MLQDYKEHCEERKKQGIPPLPLSAQQTSDLVELLKSEHAESDLLLELLKERIPAGVDDGRNQFPPWEEEHKCHEYNMAKPIVLNTHAWHWVRNNTAELRAIVSLDVSIGDIDYDRFVDELIEMKWIDQKTMYDGVRYLEDTEKYCKPNQSHKLYNHDEHQGGVEMF